MKLDAMLLCLLLFESLLSVFKSLKEISSCLFQALVAGLDQSSFTHTGLFIVSFFFQLYQYAQREQNLTQNMSQLTLFLLPSTLCNCLF